MLQPPGRRTGTSQCHQGTGSPRPSSRTPSPCRGPASALLRGLLAHPPLHSFTVHQPLPGPFHHFYHRRQCHHHVHGTLQPAQGGAWRPETPAQPAFRTGYGDTSPRGPLVGSVTPRGGLDQSWGIPGLRPVPSLHWGLWGTWRCGLSKATFFFFFKRVELSGLPGREGPRHSGSVWKPWRREHPCVQLPRSKLGWRRAGGRWFALYFARLVSAHPPCFGEGTPLSPHRGREWFQQGLAWLPPSCGWGSGVPHRGLRAPPGTPRPLLAGLAQRRVQREAGGRCGRPAA